MTVAILAQGSMLLGVTWGLGLRPVRTRYCSSWHFALIELVPHGNLLLLHLYTARYGSWKWRQWRWWLSRWYWLGSAQVWRRFEAGESPGLEEVESSSLVMTMRKLLLMEPEPTSCVEKEDRDNEDGLESSQLSTTEVTPLLSTRAF